MGGTYSTGGVFVVKEKEKGSNKRHGSKNNAQKPILEDRFEQIQSDPEGFSPRTDDEDEQFFHRFCWDRRRKPDRELIPRVRLKTPYKTPPLLTISRMLKELENETKKKNMEAIPRLRARSASASRPKPRQYIPNENVAPSAKRFNRAGQGNRCTSRYEIYNSTTRPFGKSYRDMVRTTPSDERPGNPSPTDTTCESSAESSHGAYVTACCSEVETTVQQVAGFTGGERGAALMTTIGEDDAVTEARNYDVRDAGADRAEVIDGTLKSAELVRRADEKRLMYAMPATSSWKTYDEEQLTYEPAVDELVRREVVTRSRSLFDMQEEEPAAETAPAFRRPAAPRPKLAKAASEDRLCETNAAASAVAETAAAAAAAAAAPKKYSSAVNLTLAVRNERAPESGRRGGVKYKSQTDLRAEAPPKPLERPKSVDFLAAAGGGGGGRSHAEALRKHFYYNPLKQTKRLNDHELPDPDKVLSTRQLFQKELKIPLPPHMNDRNPKTGPRPTQEVRVVPPETRSSLKKCASADLGTAVHNRWTDSGSVSSGVGSEGSFDTDHTSSETNGGLLHRACGYSSDDDDEEEDDDYLTAGKTTTVEIVGRPVSADILDKIRKFGTSVTYYGGKVISSSRGEVCSPMTMTIMDEIRHQREENVRLRLVKSNSCGSRMELTAEPRRAEVHAVESIREEEDENEDRGRDAPGGPGIVRTTAGSRPSAASSSSSDETSWKALIVIRKNTQNKVPVFDMEFEEFEVLQEENK